MALYFDANGEYVDYGTALAGLTAGTLMFWCVIVSDALRGALFSDQSTADITLDYTGTSAGDPISIQRYRATQYLLAQAPAGNFAAYGLLKWLFIAATFNSAGGDTDQKLLVGDLSTPAAEPSSYTTQRAGSGAASTGGTLSTLVGARFKASRFWPGAIAWGAVWDTALTVAEIQAQQWRSGYPVVQPGNCKLLCHYGANGVSAQPDWSGNGISGTVSGATLTYHVPLGPWFVQNAPLWFWGKRRAGRLLGNTLIRGSSL